MAGSAWQDRLVRCLEGDNNMDQFQAFATQLAIVMRSIPKRAAYHIMSVNLDLMRQYDQDDDQTVDHRRMFV